MHQFDLLELMLSNHAARVLAMGPRLASEARGMTNPLHRQCARFQYLIPIQIGYRDFCSRNQKIFRIRIGAELIFLELR